MQAHANRAAQCLPALLAAWSQTLLAMHALLLEGPVHPSSDHKEPPAANNPPHLSVMMPLPMSAMIFAAFFIVNSISFRSSTILLSCWV